MVDRVRRPSGPSGPERVDGAPGSHQRASDHPVAHLQRQVGNRVARQFVQAITVQREKEGDGPTHEIGIIQQQLNHVGSTPRLGITGRFDAATTTATKAFQKKLVDEGIKGVTEDGVVGGVTHDQLKARAPSVKVSDNDTVVDGPGHAEADLDNPALGRHNVAAKDLKKGAKGVGVKELQERLNNSGKAGKALSVDGVFGRLTDAGLRAFQTTVPLAATGIADPGTWAKLENAGAATQGHVEFDWHEEVEGVKNVGTKASYDWKLTKEAIKISVAINFRKKHSGVDGRIADWLNDIKTVWNAFKAVNHSDPAKKSMNVEFEAKRGKGHDVDVFKFDPKVAKLDRAALSRSDSGTWYTIDTRRMLAPHEFGHLIGLADEYNQTEAHYNAITGEQAPVGDVAGTEADAKKLATDIKAQLPLNDVVPAPIDTWNDKRWGDSLKAVIHGKLSQGGFAQLVSQEYAKANGGATVYGDIQAAFMAKNVPGFQRNLSRSVTPFLYSNSSLMGTGTTVTGDSGGKGVDEHEHPVEPRHVAPFVDILAREWAIQNGKADLWKPERR